MIFGRLFVGRQQGTQTNKYNVSPTEHRPNRRLALHAHIRHRAGDGVQILARGDHQRRHVERRLSVGVEGPAAEFDRGLLLGPVAPQPQRHRRARRQRPDRLGKLLRPGDGLPVAAGADVAGFSSAAAGEPAIAAVTKAPLASGLISTPSQPRLASGLPRQEALRSCRLASAVSSSTLK